MKILTEEKLRKFIRATNMDHEHNVLAGQLIEALEDVDLVPRRTSKENVHSWPQQGQTIIKLYLQGHE